MLLFKKLLSLPLIFGSIFITSYGAKQQPEWMLAEYCDDVDLPIIEGEDGVEREDEEHRGKFALPQDGDGSSPQDSALLELAADEYCKHYNPFANEEYCDDFDLPKDTGFKHPIYTPKPDTTLQTITDTLKELSKLYTLTLTRTIMNEIQAFLAQKSISLDELLFSELFQLISTTMQPNSKNGNLVLCCPAITLTAYLYFTLALNKTCTKFPDDYLTKYFDTPQKSAQFLSQTLIWALITAIKTNYDYTGLISILGNLLDESYLEKMLSPEEFKSLKLAADEKTFKLIVNNNLYKIEQEYLNLVDFDIYIDPEKHLLPLIQHILDVVTNPTPQLSLCCVY